MPKSLSPSDPWLARPPERSNSRLRLFCFPYAGGGASIFRNWPKLLPSSVEVVPVQLPGREARFREKPFSQMVPLIEALTPALEPYLTMPYAFFGHSMGSIVSFELAHELRRRRKPEPSYLFVSGRRAPKLPDPDPPKYNLPDEEFMEELRTLEGTPPEVLAHPELMELMLPLLRADFELCDTYTSTGETPLECPISAFGGTTDPETTREELEGWQEETTNTFKARFYQGNHFFLTENLEAILRAIAHDVMSKVAL